MLHHILCHKTFCKQCLVIAASCQEGYYAYYKKFIYCRKGTSIDSDCNKLMCVCEKERSCWTGFGVPTSYDITNSNSNIGKHATSKKLCILYT